MKTRTIIVNGSPYETAMSEASLARQRCRNEGCANVGGPVAHTGKPMRLAGPYTQEVFVCQMCKWEWCATVDHGEDADLDEASA